MKSSVYSLESVGLSLGLNAPGVVPRRTKPQEGFTIKDGQLKAVQAYTLTIKVGPNENVPERNVLCQTDADVSAGQEAVA